MQTNQDKNDNNQQTGELTAQQIKNWRRVLYGIIGPLALMVPDDEIQKIRDEMQGKIDKESTNQ